MQKLFYVKAGSSEQKKFPIAVKRCSFQDAVIFREDIFVRWGQQRCPHSIVVAAAILCSSTIIRGVFETNSSFRVK